MALGLFFDPFLALLADPLRCLVQHARDGGAAVLFFAVEGVGHRLGKHGLVGDLERRPALRAVEEVVAVAGGMGQRADPQADHQLAADDLGFAFKASAAFLGVGLGGCWLAKRGNAGTQDLGVLPHQLALLLQAFLLGRIDGGKDGVLADEVAQGCGLDVQLGLLVNDALLMGLQLGGGAHLVPFRQALPGSLKTPMPTASACGVGQAQVLATMA